MATVENEAIKTIANEIIKAIRTAVEKNNKSQINNFANYLINAPANAQTGSEMATRLVQSLDRQAVVSAEKAVIDTAQIRNLEAEVISAVEANIETINADYLKANRVQAVEGSFARLDAESATVGFADIRDLVSSAMVLSQGTMGTVYIDNLAVTNALMVSATLGHLVLKGTDNKYYEVYIEPDVAHGGKIKTQEVSVTAGEIAAGVTSEGRSIVETSADFVYLNSKYLNVESETVGEILAGALHAGFISATEALISSAIIPTIYTDAIGTIGESLTLSGSNVNIVLGDTSQSAQELIATIRSDLEDTDSTAKEANTAITSLSTEYSPMLSDAKSWFSFSEVSGVPTFTIAKNNSRFKIKITNEKMSFMSDDAEVAYIKNDNSGNKLFIQDAEITHTLVFGGLKLVKTSENGTETGVGFTSV